MSSERLYRRLLLLWVAVSGVPTHPPRLFVLSPLGQEQMYLSGNPVKKEVEQGTTVSIRYETKTTIDSIQKERK